MNVLWGRVVVLGVVLLLVFLLGRATGGSNGEVDELRAQISSQETEIDQLEAENRALAAAATTTDPPPTEGQNGAGTAPGDTTGGTTTPGDTTGGTTTPGTTATPTPSPTASPDTSQPQEYTVAAGDTLGRISSRFYGSTAFVTCIQQANEMETSNIRSGQTLTIPPRPAAPCT